MKNVFVLFDQVKKMFIVSAIFFPKDLKTQTRVICDFRTFAQDESFKKFSFVSKEGKVLINC